jgi:predicted O-linked N-acetylglucosamine transferase (SPINDLY family)
MSEIGRNDPCACGSGRKAKNCCQRPAVPAVKMNSVILPAIAGAPARRVALAEALHVAAQLQQTGQIPAAKMVFELIVAADADHADALFFLGVTCHQLGQSAQGIDFMRRAIVLQPNNRLYHFNFGIINAEMGDTDAAIEAYERSIQIQPTAEACNNCAGLLLNEGRLDEASELFRRGGELSPDDVNQQSNFLYTLSYKPHPNVREIFNWHKQFGQRHERTIAPMPPRARMDGARADQRLRIGYVSPDFRQHAVAHFIEPVLAAHDSKRFEIFCYYNYPAADTVTGRFEKLAHHWRVISNRSDEDVANMIRADGIDILVDLAGHTPLNRLRVFARKPAPVQASWIGYSSTTGLTRMDYRITDTISDPIGVTDDLYTEKLVRLPDTYSCFQPLANSPDVAELPATQSGHVTFGSFNNFIKMTPEVLQTWARILQRVPTSILLLKYRSFEAEKILALVLAAFAKHGVQPARIHFLGSDDYHTHLRAYHQVDIALDTFPHNGDTTTCDALWMGVPVVVNTGVNHVGLMGASRLRSVGLEDLVARDNDNYVDIATALANDVPRLEKLRATLRETMKASPLMDAPRFTRNLEAAYEKMWTNLL